MENKVYLSEIGVSGFQRYGTLYENEWLPELRGLKAIKVYKEMRDNEPLVSAILFAIEMLVRQVEWKVVPYDVEDPEARYLARFIEECLYDMSYSWQDILADILSFLVFGFSVFEIVYKIRAGDQDLSRYRSKYSDYRIGWRKFAYRDPETIWKFEYDPEGGIMGVWQIAPPHYKMVFIPIDKLLLFRLNKQMPEGRSILRSMYKPYYYKRQLEIIEAIGMERDLAGFPVLYVPPELFDQNDPGAREKLEKLKTIIKNIRRDEEEGLILPSLFEDGQPLYKLELLSSSGRQFDIDKVITRYEQRMAISVMADFLLLGQTNTGSYALSLNKSQLFLQALNTVLQTICETINQYAIPRLLKLNGFNTSKAPDLTYGTIQEVDLKELGDFISKLANAGAPLFPDPELEEYLRKRANLPATNG